MMAAAAVEPLVEELNLCVSYVVKQTKLPTFCAAFGRLNEESMSATASMHAVRTLKERPSPPSSSCLQTLKVKLKMLARRLVQHPERGGSRCAPPRCRARCRARRSRSRLTRACLTDDASRLCTTCDVVCCVRARAQWRAQQRGVRALGRASGERAQNKTPERRLPRCRLSRAARPSLHCRDAAERDLLPADFPKFSSLAGDPRKGRRP